MAVPDSDEVRAAAFAYVDRLVQGAVPYVTRAQLEGFVFEGELVPLITQQGIRKPSGWSTVLAVVSTSRAAGDGGYDDVHLEDGRVLYRYMRSGASYSDSYNAALARTADEARPILYLIQVAPGVYEPTYPIFVEATGAHDGVLLSEDPPAGEYGDLIDIRQYRERSQKVRLHQREFRARVLYAYEDRCCICRLARRGLLDAAHIIDDANDEGYAVVQNGLSMCRIHHGAYDQYLIGIRPDLTIDVATDVLEEVDGPMLQHMLKDIRGQRINVPRSRSAMPRPEALEWKYERFRSAG